MRTPHRVKFAGRGIVGHRAPKSKLVSKRLPLVLWLLSVPLIFSLILGGRVERAQEARVLETAREMFGQGWQNWLIPHCNAQVRLRKPPLAYWVAAGSFKIFGVDDWAGRIPFAFASWLTLGATYAACRPIIRRRGALLASAGLTGTYFFVRFGRYAETDVLAALFVTAAIAAIIHGALARRTSRRMINFLVAGVCIGLAVMSKGPPAVFPVVFLIGLAAVLRRWRILSEFLLSGSFLAAAAIALPWWIYISQLPEFKTVGNEIKKVTLGLDHPGPPWFYFLVSLVAIAPWSGFVVLGVIEAVRRFRQDLRARIILAWIGCIIIPLSLVGKKQDHYMLPLLPPLMAAGGWAIDRGLRDRGRMRRAIDIILFATTIVCLVGAAAPFIIARSIRGSIGPADYRLAFVIVFCAGLQLAVFRRRRAFNDILNMMILTAILMVAIDGFWRPMLEPISYPEVAARIQKEFGDRELALFEDENLPICFYWAKTLPFYATREELLEALARRPNLVVIREQQRADELPPPGKETARIHMRKRDIVIYEQK
jgi:4-amino-4-deoxy-L-arabinose transferase-like glycosyltransferase